VDYTYIYNLAQSSKMCVTGFYMNNSTQKSILEVDPTKLTTISLDFTTSNWTQTQADLFTKYYRVSATPDWSQKQLYNRACYNSQSNSNTTLLSLQDQSVLQSDYVVGFSAYSDIDGKIKIKKKEKHLQ
jgi:hypothetical protein